MTLEGPKAARGLEIRSAGELGSRIFNPGGTRMPARPLPSPAPDEVRENLRVFTDGDKVVSVVAMNYREIVLMGTRHLACCFGGVCTDPDYRDKQLASRLLIDCKQKAIRDGADIVLISGRIGIYVRQGYVHVGDYSICTVSRDRLPSDMGEGTNKYVVRPPAPEDLPALFRMYLAEPVRFVRTPDELMNCVIRTRVLNGQGETLVVCPQDGARPVAYVTSFFAGQAGHQKDSKAIQIVELAGSRWAVLHALPLLLERRGLESLELRYGGWDEELTAMVQAYGWPVQPFGFRGTVGIINPTRFWEACADLFRDRLGQDKFRQLRFSADGPVKIGYGTAELVLDDMTAFTRLVLEHPARRHELQLGLPAESGLARVLEALFPLPVVNYGLTYL